MHWPLLESLVERGSVLIVADCGIPEVCRHRSFYSQAWRFLRVRAGLPADGRDARAENGIPPESDRQIICHAQGMTVSEWLKPALSGISQIAVRNPARLESWEQIVAAGPTQVSGTAGLQNGSEAEKAPWVFASAG
ncbi:MAG TPA: hypothetical protein VNJ12_03530 [Candidatus Dormibacteraeota bacterium]|nr:hypothetical protein [Candidatus Dormibacteraeota bacterium]